MTDSLATGGSTPAPVVLPGDFQDRVFKAIAVQRPAALAYIQEVRRKHPGASPADVMRIIEQHYVRTTTSASAAVEEECGLTGAEHL